MAEMHLMYPPGLTPSYSNAGSTVLGRALENVAGRTWEDYVMGEIVEPLGMVNTHTTINTENLAVGYTSDGQVPPLWDNGASTRKDLLGPVALTPSSPPCPATCSGFTAPCGQMISCVADLAALVSDLFNFDRPTAKLLKPESIRDWLHPAYVYRDGTGFGHPWEILRAGNYTFLSKGGNHPGYSSEFVFLPDIKAGAVVLVAETDSPLQSLLPEILGDFILTRSVKMSTGWW
jgi:CubicO group peptidase (beta-lactamase class C family)